MRCERHRALYCIVDECRRADRARNREATTPDVADVAVIELVVIDPAMYDSSTACDITAPDTCDSGG